MRMFTRFFRPSIALLIALAWVPALHAQNTTGEIDGTVLDGSGAAIPGAKVTITNSDTKEVVRTVIANKKGEFAIPLLNVGTYSVTGAADGFEATSVDRVELHVGDQLTISPKLKPGATDVTVQVDAQQVAPDIQNATMGSVVNSTEVTELALGTRNFEQLVLLQPGVAYNGDDTVYPGQIDTNGNLQQAKISVNGLRPTQLSWSLDGADTLNQETSANSAIFPNVETIAQIQTLRNSYGAQYGGGGSAQIITTTKSGTTTFHGDAYFFLRNQYLNANSFFNLIAAPVLPRPPLQQNTFGYTVGGPVFIPKIYPRDKTRTFFFFAQEFRRLHLYPVDRVPNLPSAQEIQGHVTFTNVANTCPPGFQVNAAPADPNYPCYIIGAIDPAAQAFIKDVIGPVLAANPPNDPTNPQNGLIEQVSSTARSNSETFRLDHQWSPRVQSFVRYTFDPNNQNVPSGIGRNDGFPGVGNSTIYSYGEEITPHTTIVLNASTVAEIGYSYLSYVIKARPYGLALATNSPDFAAAVKLPYPDTLGRIPTVAITGSTNFGTNGPRTYLNHTQQAFVNVTKQWGPHTLYFGANYEHFYGNVNNGTANAGTFSFLGQFYLAFPKFLLGTADTFTQASIDAVAHIQQNVIEGYVQDAWKTTSHLTLNAGVRYTYSGQAYDGRNHLGGFDVNGFNVQHEPAFGPVGATSDGVMCITANQGGTCTGVSPNPAYDPYNGIIQGGTNSPYGRAVAAQPVADFAPRVGFAYDVYGDGKTALRGGYGIFFNHVPLTIPESAVYGNPRYVQNLSVVNASFDAPTVVTQTATLDITGTNPNWRTPYTQSWSLDLQQTLATNWLLDVAYVGSSTQHLQGEEDLNQPLPGEFLLFNINGSKIPTGASQDEGLNAIRPYPGWGAILYDSTRFFADYHGLQVQSLKRFSNHSVISVSYTWSKSMANSQGEAGSDPQNRYDLHAEWGPTNFDARGVLVAHYVYDLPFFNNDHGWKGYAFGGWQVSGIYQMRDGNPLTAGNNQRDPAGQGTQDAGSNAASRPNYLKDPNNGAPHTQAAFIDPIPTDNYVLAVPAGTTGTERVGSIYGPDYKNLTADLFKNVTFKERFRLQLRVEAFNVLNHVNFNAITLGVRNGGFGQVTSAFDNRQLQVGAKAYF